MEHHDRVWVPAWSSRTRRVAIGAGALAVLAGFAGAAEAKCQDGPAPGVDWSGCSKARLLLANDDLTGAILSRSLLTLSDFATSKMAGAKLDETEVSRTRFEGTDLARADFSKALGWRANFGQAILMAKLARAGTQG